ncbi:KTSC domain-containing protein [Rhizobium mesosinicum]|uniref:KTSC domain-containing protein n=1 Tax=Rhizobium mesosinicum TaxID=335017 RepID=A0ABS7GTS2_9HYPH|nr:KTSC domain-containing protein [Rhizobium mesosinicum]MBW9053358.1 KTSC domain-containing protein [Rhizobium mesosinicum]
MNWVPLNSKRIRAVSYDPETQVLHAKFAGGRAVRHAGVLPHIYDNLIETSDPEFYYKYYLEPLRIQAGWRQKASLSSHTVKLLIFFIGALVITATALEENGELPIHLSEIAKSGTIAPTSGEKSAVSPQ